MENKKLPVWISSIIISLVLTLLIKIFIFDFVKIEGRSMEPTLMDGNRLIINKFEYRIGKPKRKEIVVFSYPKDEKYQFVKRIIAIEGDTIEIKNGKVLLNEEPLKEPYIFKKTTENFYKRVVPKDTIFVLGDNRINSKDSRYEDIGFIPLDLIKGKISYRIFPINHFGKVK